MSIYYFYLDRTTVVRATVAVPEENHDYEDEGYIGYVDCDIYELNDYIQLLQNAVDSVTIQMFGKTRMLGGKRDTGLN